MNNTQPTFDPMTGQPLNSNINTQPTFDPMTGQPLNSNINNQAILSSTENNQISPAEITITQNQSLPTSEANTNLQTEMITAQLPQENNVLSTQQQMQSIPTVEQSTQDFISNTQAINEEKKEEKKEGPNIVFIVILFAIIFAAIFFLFPYLLKF